MCHWNVPNLRLGNWPCNLLKSNERDCTASESHGPHYQFLAGSVAFNPSIWLRHADALKQQAAASKFYRWNSQQMWSRNDQKYRRPPIPPITRFQISLLLRALENLTTLSWSQASLWLRILGIYNLGNKESVMNSVHTMLHSVVVSPRVIEHLNEMPGSNTSRGNRFSVSEKKTTCLKKESKQWFKYYKTMSFSSWFYDIGTIV